MRGGAGNVNAELYIRNVFVGLGGPRRVSNIPDYTIAPKLPFKLGDQRGIRE